MQSKCRRQVNFPVMKSVLSHVYIMNVPHAGTFRAGRDLLLAKSGLLCSDVSLVPPGVGKSLLYHIPLCDGKSINQRDAETRAGGGWIALLAL